MLRVDAADVCLRADVVTVTAGGSRSANSQSVEHESADATFRRFASVSQSGAPGQEQDSMQASSTSLLAAYRFGPFRLVISERILERNGERIHLTPKVIDTLFVLIANAPHVVSKQAIMQAVWPDVSVVESGLTRNISALRKAMESDAAAGPFLETIPRRGYRFVAEVIAERMPPPPTAHPPETVQPATQRIPAHLRIAAATAVMILLSFLLLHSNDASAEITGNFAPGQIVSSK